MSVPQISRPSRVVPVTLPAIPGVPLTGVTHDSRSVQPGDLYAALPGARVHGAQFIDQAIEAGAVAVLTDPAGAQSVKDIPTYVVADPRAALGELSAEIYRHPSRKLTVVGITGTNGKTTTAYLIEAGLRRAGHTTALFGTVETRIAGESLPSVRTTPEAPELQALLALAVERGVTAVAMEVSSHALALHRVDGIDFAAGIFTNLGSDHLDFHGTAEEYFAAKARLFDGRSRIEVVNVDDPAGRTLVKPGTITVSFDGAEARWRVTDREPGRFSQTFGLQRSDGTKFNASVPMPGSYNVDNAALALVTLIELGIEPLDAIDGVATAAPAPGRMERVEFSEPVLAVVDYAHDPRSVRAALEALRPITKGRLICVLGCGGDRDRGKRPLMGAAAARAADVLIATDDNPRSELPADIRSAMLAGARDVPESERAQIVEIPDRRKAIAEAVRLSRPDDTIAVLGKGHEQGQEIAGVLHPFDDRRELSTALREVFS